MSEWGQRESRGQKEAEMGEAERGMGGLKGRHGKAGERG